MAKKSAEKSADKKKGPKLYPGSRTNKFTPYKSGKEKTKE